MITNNHNNNFTLLRITAASLVLFSHSYALTAKGHIEPLLLLTGIEHFGGLAVSIFFVISGFLVTASLTKSNSVYRYLRNRSLRILPGMTVMVLLTTFVLGFMLTTANLKEYFSNPLTWVYLKNIYLFDIQYYLPGVFDTNIYPKAVNGSIWTLPFEFAAYLVLAIIFICKALKPRFLIIIISALYVLDVKLITTFNLNDLTLLSMPIFHLGKFWIFFFAGSLLYCLKDQISFNYITFCCALALLIASFKTPSLNVIYYLTLPYLVICLAYMPCFLSRYMERLGDISYGVYLYAFPVQQTIICLTHGNIDLLSFNLIAFIITFILGTLSWHFIEKPALNLKKKRLLSEQEKLASPNLVSV